MADYTARSRRHVFTHGHAANAQPQAGKSRFRPTEGLQKFTDEVSAAAGPPIVQAHGKLRFEALDLGRVTGRDAAGNPVRGGVVVIAGPQTPYYVPNEFITQFPFG
jgi:hypothetical protein